MLHINCTVFFFLLLLLGITYLFSNCLNQQAQRSTVDTVLIYSAAFLKLVLPSGWDWAPESHHGCHTDHQAAGGDHIRVWEAEDSWHQGLLHWGSYPPQIKNFSFSGWKYTACLLKQWVTVKWNQTVMTLPVVFDTCPHLLILLQLFEVILVLSFQNSLSCLVAIR